MARHSFMCLYRAEKRLGSLFSSLNKLSASSFPNVSPKTVRLWRKDLVEIGGLERYFALKKLWGFK